MYVYSARQTTHQMHNFLFLKKHSNLNAKDMLISIIIEIFHMSSWDAWNDNFFVSHKAAYAGNPLWKYFNIFSTTELTVPLSD